MLTLGRMRRAIFLGIAVFAVSAFPALGQTTGSSGAGSQTNAPSCDEASQLPEPFLSAHSYPA